MTVERSNAAMTVGIRLGLVLLAVWLGYQSWVRNLDHACRANEWPYLERCDEVRNQTPAQRAEWLQQRLRRNPGDSLSAVHLAILASQFPIRSR